MSWIESHQALLTHRKTLRAASKLSVSKYLLIGHLHALWWWGLDNADEQGRLGEAFPEELGEAAGFTGKKSAAFVDALVFVKFLEETPNGYVFHNWPRYTWRYYQGKEKKDDASTSGSFGNHKRWHLDRGVIAPDCELCITPISPRLAPDVAPDVGVDIAPESRNASRPIATNQPNLTEPTEPNQTKQPTRLNLPNRAVVVGFEQCFGRLLSPMELEEVKALEDEQPKERIEFALREAAALNKRSVRYVQRTCERIANDADDADRGQSDAAAHPDGVADRVSGMDRRRAAVAGGGRQG